MSHLLMRDINEDALMTRMQVCMTISFCCVSVGQLPGTAVGYRDAKKAALEHLNGCPDRKIVGVKPPAHLHNASRKLGLAINEVTRWKKRLLHILHKQQEALREEEDMEEEVVCRETQCCRRHGDLCSACDNEKWGFIIHNPREIENMKTEECNVCHGEIVFLDLCKCHLHYKDRKKMEEEQKRRQREEEEEEKEINV